MFIPCHFRHEGRVGIHLVGSEVENPFSVVGEEFVAEHCCSDSHLPADIHLPRYVIDGPVGFAWRHEVDSQSGAYRLSVASLLPVGSKGEEVVSSEIHHGVYLVHPSLFHPFFHILTTFLLSVPSPAPVSVQVVSFADRRTAHLQPWLLCFHGIVDAFHYV